MKKYLVLAAAVAALSSALSPARADSGPVSLDTYQGSGWQVQRILIGGESNSSGGTTLSPVQNVAVNPGWLYFDAPGLGGDSRWVSWDTTTGGTVTDNVFTDYQGDVEGTHYIFSKTFQLNGFDGPGIFQLHAAMTMDNWATNVALTADNVDVPVTIDPALQPENLGYVHNIDVTGYHFTSPATFVLTINSVNAYMQDDKRSGTNPTDFGFILSGAASAVPNPEPASLGILLAGGAILALRKRR